MGIRFLVFLILLLAGVGFIAGLISAIQFSFSGTPDDMPRFIRQVVTAIGGILATNLGAVLGVKIEQAKSLGFDTKRFFVGAVGDAPSTLQLVAAYLYVFGLLVALWGWWKLGFTEDPSKVVVTLPQLSQTLLGVAVGVLAVALGNTRR